MVQDLNIVRVTDHGRPPRGAHQVSLHHAADFGYVGGSRPRIHAGLDGNDHRYRRIIGIQADFLCNTVIEKPENRLS